MKTSKFKRWGIQDFFKTEKQREHYYRYSERQRIRRRAFEQALGWLNKLGPVGKFYHTFYYILYFEGPKGLTDGLSFSYFGDVLFWGKPVTVTPFSNFIGLRKNTKNQRRRFDEAVKYSAEVLTEWNREDIK